MGPQLTFDLLIFDRNEGAIAKEVATREALHEEFNARLKTAAGEVRALLSEHKLLERQLKSVEPRLRKTKAIAAQTEAAYKQNLIDERAYLETQIARLTIERQKIELEQELFEGQVSLEKFTGTDITQMSISTDEPQDGVIAWDHESIGSRDAPQH